MAYGQNACSCDALQEPEHSYGMRVAGETCRERNASPEKHVVKTCRERNVSPEKRDVRETCRERNVSPEKRVVRAPHTTNNQCYSSRKISVSSN